MGDVRSYRSLPTLLVIIGSFALFALLAMLQYHWLSQLSSGERIRMGSALQTSVARFCEDFDRELARAWVAFRMDGAALRRRKWAQFGERYARWVKQSPHPRLVSALFLVSEGGKGELQVKRFDPDAKTFAPSSAPAELQLLRQKMEKRRQGLRLPDHFGMPFFPQVFADAPLLLIPVVPMPEGVSPPLQTVTPQPSEISPPLPAFTLNLPERDTFSYIVAQLDSEYIRSEFIPELAKRYFSDGAEWRASEYQLSIISQTDPAMVIYSTASAPLTASEVDASGAMLTLRPQLVENFAFEIASPVGAGTPAPGTLAGRRRLDHPGLRAGQRAGPDHSGRQTIAFINPASSGPLVAHASPGFRVERETGSWRLLVNHRAGSLKGAAEKLRRQNLFVFASRTMGSESSRQSSLASSNRSSGEQRPRRRKFRATGLGSTSFGASLRLTAARSRFRVRRDKAASLHYASRRHLRKFAVTIRSIEWKYEHTRSID